MGTWVILMCPFNFLCHTSQKILRKSKYFDFFYKFPKHRITIDNQIPNLNFDLVSMENLSFDFPQTRNTSYAIYYLLYTISDILKKNCFGDLEERFSGVLQKCRILGQRYFENQKKKSVLVGGTSVSFARYYKCILLLSKAENIFSIVLFLRKLQLFKWLNLQFQLRNLQNEL